MIKVQHNGVAFAAHRAGVLVQIRHEVRSAAMSTSQDIPRVLDPLIPGRATLGEGRQDKVLKSE